MSAADDRKTCSILLGMGGPGSLEEVKGYLYNIFCDRSIIRLPGGAFFQKPFALLISNLRAKKVKAHYQLIGGKSPLLSWTKSQADQIAAQLKSDHSAFECRIGMRYSAPYVDEAIEQAYADGFRRIIFLPMFPHYSHATTGSSFEVAKKTCAIYKDLETIYIKDYHDNQAYVELLKKYVISNIGPDDTLLFSAHSLPQKFVDEGDPYVDQTYQTAKLVAGDREHFVSFQSRTGPVDWVGPDTVDEVKRLLSERKGNLFVVPISFVCDHIETLYEIDIELPELLPEKDRARLKRMPMFNADPEFATLLAGLIKEGMNSHASN